MSKSTKEQIDDRKELLRSTISVYDVLIKYGVYIKHGRCKGICHAGTNLNAKISSEYLWCYACNSSMDIFDITMHFNNCDFWTAFELLGGTERPSFTAVIKANRAKKERELRNIQNEKEKAYLRQIQKQVTAYRNIINEEEPFSKLWYCCHNKLQYQLYLLELQNEKR